jgi:hypothetical protein
LREEIFEDYKRQTNNMQQQNAKIEIDDSTIPDIRKALGNPKITFVLGGPASGKGT